METSLLNRVENVTPCFFPLSSHEAFAPFYVYDLRPGGALHSLGRPSPLRDGPPLLKTGAVAATIDALVSRHGLPPPNLLKLDVDGNEEQILDGRCCRAGFRFVAFHPREVTWPDERKPHSPGPNPSLLPMAITSREKAPGASSSADHDQPTSSSCGKLTWCA